MEAAAVTDWTLYRACPVCKAPLGAACFTRSGAVVDGRPDNVVQLAPRAHIARKLRTPR